MAGLWSHYLRGRGYAFPSAQHFFLGNRRNAHYVPCYLRNADCEKENRERMGMCIRVLFYLERLMNPGLSDGKAQTDQAEHLSGKR